MAVGVGGRWLLGSPVGAGGTPTILDQISAFLHSIETEIPGACAAAVDLRSGTSGAVAIGLADVATNRPFATDTIVSIDSVTKMFTTIILAQAVTGGLGRDRPITLDATIDGYLLPYMAQYGKTVPSAIAGITLEELANYTSGFPDRPSNETDSQSYTIPELVDWLAGRRCSTSRTRTCSRPRPSSHASPPGTPTSPTRRPPRSPSPPR